MAQVSLAHSYPELFRVTGPLQSIGAFCLHRQQWVVLWKVTNEVLEELGLVLNR